MDELLAALGAEVLDWSYKTVLLRRGALAHPSGHRRLAQRQSRQPRAPGRRGCDRSGLPAVPFEPGRPPVPDGSGRADAGAVFHPVDGPGAGPARQGRHAQQEPGRPRPLLKEKGLLPQ